MLYRCTSNIGRRKIFILNGDQDICKHPGAILIIPELSEQNILRVLSIAESCSRKGSSLGGIVFLAKTFGSQRKKSMMFAWKLFEKFGVMIFRILKLKKHVRTTWSLR